MNLGDISALVNYQFVQQLDASHNNLKSLYGTPNLVHINASHNKLTDFLVFLHHRSEKQQQNSLQQQEKDQEEEPCESLLIADYSHNQIEKLNADLVMRFSNLCVVNLSHNHLYTVQALGELVNLIELDISDNQIITLEGLRSLKLLRILKAVSCFFFWKKYYFLF